MTESQNKVTFLRRRDGDYVLPGYIIRRGSPSYDWGLLEHDRDGWMWRSWGGVEFGCYRSFAEAKRRIRAELEKKPG